MPRERKRQEGIKFVPMWTAATGDGSNLESPRARSLCFEIMAVGKKR